MDCSNRMLCSCSTWKWAQPALLLPCCLRRFGETSAQRWSFRAGLKQQRQEAGKNVRRLRGTRLSVFVQGQHTLADVFEEEDKYEFHDEGKEVEVRLPLPKGAEGLTASDLAVDIEEKSVIVAVQTGDGVKVLLAATCLYGFIKPSETMWFVDEETVVISLKKVDTEGKWPGLEEDWNSLASGVGDLIKGTSVYVVGERTDINWAVARDMATGLGYVPLKSLDLVEQLMGKTTAQLIAEEGEGAVADTEAQILCSLASNVRCVVATIGGQQGAAANPRLWNSLHTGFTMWLKESQAPDQASAQQEVVQEKSGAKAYAKADVVVAVAGWDNSSVRPIAQGALRALKYLVEANKDLPGKKSLYVRLGARGDWPEIMPPAWNPEDK